MARLSENQKRVLKVIYSQTAKPQEICDPGTPHNGKEMTVPLYIEHLPRFMFNTYREQERFLANLEKRGFIRIHKRNFFFITDEGRKVVEDFQTKEGATP